MENFIFKKKKTINFINFMKFQRKAIKKQKININ